MKKYSKQIIIPLTLVACVATNVFLLNTLKTKSESKILELSKEIEGKNSALLKEEEVNAQHQKKIVGLNDKVDGLEKSLKSTKEELAKKQKTLSNLKKENKQKRSVVGDGRVIKIKLTGYCPCSYCCGVWAYKNPGITASGTKAKFGTIAAPESLPFGTKMKIQGYGDKIFTVEDTGSAVIEKNGIYVIDMWMPTHSQAYAVGNSIVEAVLVN